MITRLFNILIITMLPLLAVANGPHEDQLSLFDYISGQEVLEVEIRTDFDQLTTKGENMDYQPGQITFVGVDGIPATWEMRVKARGRFRYRICEFPPLKIDLDKDDLREQGLAEFDDFKLVTHCTGQGAQARDNVLREYMAYRLYNQLTDQSFRVQLLRITYRDAEGKKIMGKQWGFLIEDTAEMVDRLGGEEVELLNQPASEFDTRAEHRMSYFQYVIGNSDYDLKHVRNIKLVRLHQGGGLIPVPYDFDFSLLVDAPYAIPNNNAGQMRLSDRVYLGFERTDDEIRYMEKYFESMRKVLETTVREDEALNWVNRNHILDILNGFYEEGWTAKLYHTQTSPDTSGIGK